MGQHGLYFFPLLRVKRKQIATSGVLAMKEQRSSSAVKRPPAMQAQWCIRQKY
jgi:hypothetical protein